MALNPFFLQGSLSEQRLVQDLINEQLKIYGVDVTYIPRKFVRTQDIIREVQSSKFDDNYLIEAYIVNYDGYGGSGDILTKFGMSIRDELTLVISKERFEDFITPFMGQDQDDGIVEYHRPREGDLVYFPLGQRLFEIKFVEHEQPFYQLNKTYVYELKCELFEFEDEVIDTSIPEIDSRVEDKGYITTLSLAGIGTTATATAVMGTGYIRRIYLNDDGSGFTSTPTVAISTSPTGDTASAVAITTSKGGVVSVSEIYMTNAGSGYTTAPSITISGGGGTGAAATCSIETSGNGVIRYQVTGIGSGYAISPGIQIENPIAPVTYPNPAIGLAVYSPSTTGISTIYVIDAGAGYGSTPAVTVQGPPVLTGSGDYLFNEIITGSISGTTARVKSWNALRSVLEISYVAVDDNGRITTTPFTPGESIVGSSSSAIYSLISYDSDDAYDSDKYSENDEIEEAADLLIDFSESNPFGNF